MRDWMRAQVFGVALSAGDCWIQSGFIIEKRPLERLDEKDIVRRG
jgi:hypothetical protein